LRDAGDARLEIEEVLHELAAGKPAPPAPARRRMSLVGLAIALALALGAGVVLGMWSRTDWQSVPPTEARPAGWAGQVLLGGTTRAFGPRVSPNSQWLAFSVLHDGQAQVGVMNLGSGEWWVLTRESRHGGVGSICWSADSNFLFYD